MTCYYAYLSPEKGMITVLACKRTWVLLGVCAVFFVPPVTSAQPSENGSSSKDGKDKDALVHYRRGEALFKAQRYREAISEFEKAYAIAPVPELILNLAQAHRNAGDKRAAQKYYERFLKDATAHPMAKEAARISTQLQQEIAKEDREAAANRRRLEGERAAALRSAQRVGRVTRIVGLVTLAAAVVGFGVGTKFALDARRLENELNAHDEPWTHELITKFSEGERAETRALWIGGISAGLFVAGGITYLLGRRARTKATERAHQRYRLTPSVTPGGISVQGAF